MKRLKKIIILLILVIFNACTCAMVMKAAIGVGAYDAMSQTISKLTNIKVGTIGIGLNCTCVLLELSILKKNFRFSHFLQIIISFLLGFVVNFMLYSVFSFTVTTYYMRVALLIAAYVLMAICVGGIMALDVVTFPVEGFCMVFSKKFNLNFEKVRLSIDVSCIILSVTLTYIHGIPSIIREGTVIAMILFVPLMNLAMEKEKVIFKKLSIID